MSASVKPFPFSSLESFTRKEALDLAQLRLASRDWVRLGTFARALQTLVNERIVLRLRSLRSAGNVHATDDTIGVLLATEQEATSSRRVLVDVETSLALAVVARAVRQPPGRLPDPTRAHPPAIFGAFAAVLSAALRSSHNGIALSVLAAGPGSILARELFALEPRMTTAWFTVLLGDEAFSARVRIPSSASLSVPSREFHRKDLVAMGQAQIALPVVVATTLARRSDLRELSRGDAFVPNTFTISTSKGCLHGTVALVAPRGEVGIAATLAENGHLVIREELENHGWEPHVSSEPLINSASVLEEAPVVVRVELGTVEMPARDWAALGPGDILMMGRKVGDPAILRVGGVELARGELVHVDGELAVRILSSSNETDPS